MTLLVNLVRTVPSAKKLSRHTHTEMQSASQNTGKLLWINDIDCVTLFPGPLTNDDTT